MSLVHAYECGSLSWKPGPECLEERKRQEGAQPKLTEKGAEE